MLFHTILNLILWYSHTFLYELDIAVIVVLADMVNDVILQ